MFLFIFEDFIYSLNIHFLTVLSKQWLLPNGAKRWSSQEERNEGVNQHVEVVAARPQEEPLPDQGRKDNARHHHEDDAHSGSASFKCEFLL